MTPASNQESGDTLALLRSAGIGRFGMTLVEAGTGPAPPAADQSTAGDDTLSLLRSAGLGRFAAGEPNRSRTTPTQNNSSATIAADDTLALIRASGIGRYGAGAGAAPHAQSVPIASIVGPNPDLIAATPAPLANPPRPLVPPAVARGPALSKEQYLVLAVAPGGEDAMNMLQERMGVPFAAVRKDGNYRFACRGGNGEVQYAFRCMADQLAGFGGLLGDLGTPSLRLSVTGIDLKAFKYEGSGGTDNPNARRGPPQLPLDLAGALRSALAK